MRTKSVTTGSRVVPGNTTLLGRTDIRGMDEAFLEQVAELLAPLVTGR